ncbi:MAG: glycine--tRNA ligase subunit alpha [Elusimicrobia bacterium HGW-Elusimicrobia-2]|nr:MAG: glycine--tRNA ligase subunit alpha [Elusimicrobia bacterium HGW-Elusimicrobia-2]
MKTLQDIIKTLSDYWGDKGCVVAQPYDVEKGAGTFNPMTFLKLFDKGPWRTAYVEPARRPQDGRYGDNPFRLYKHLQFQVILKPAPADSRLLYLKSLSRIGIDMKKHDIRFLEDNWESPSLGAWGRGWEVRCDGLEITQFTYFQQAGGIELEDVPVELTYGLERIAMFLQKKKSVYDIDWSETVKYGTLRKEDERQFSVYYFEKASVEGLRKVCDFYRGELEMLLENKLPLPAYDCLLNFSHIFNVIDARGGIDHTTRADMIKQMRGYANRIALMYKEIREQS